MSEAIFCHKDGKPIHSFKKGFNALIKEGGVEFDSNGQRRVIDSLRQVRDVPSSRGRQSLHPRTEYGHISEDA